MNIKRFIKNVKGSMLWKCVAAGFMVILMIGSLILPERFSLRTRADDLLSGKESFAVDDLEDSEDIRSGLESSEDIYVDSEKELGISEDLSLGEMTEADDVAYEPENTLKTDIPFSESETVDGITVSVTAGADVFPEGAALVVNKVTDDEEQQINQAVDRVRSEGIQVAEAYTFDIKIVDENGVELQPADGQTVNVSFSIDDITNQNLTTDVYHVPEEDGQLVAEELPISENENVVTAVSDGFSYYTVEFTYNEKQYVMNGDTTIPLSDILNYVGLTGEVTAVSVSNESLFSASHESGEWMVTAHQAFHTNEWMKVTIDGVEYEIVVTDAIRYCTYTSSSSSIQIKTGDILEIGDQIYTTRSYAYLYVRNTENAGYETIKDRWFDSVTTSNNYWTADKRYIVSDTQIDSSSNLYKSDSIYLTALKEDNPLTYISTQSVDKTFSTSSQTATLTAASNGQGTVTYAINSQKQGTTNVSYFTLNGATLTIAANTPAGTYTVVVRATAAGNDNYNSGTKDSTVTITIGKAGNPLAYTSPQSVNKTFSTSSQTATLAAASNGQGTVTYAINSQKNSSNSTVTYFTLSGTTLTVAANTPVGTYTVIVRATAAGNGNYNSGTKDSTVTVTIGKAGNPLTYTLSQSVNKTFSTSSQTATLAAASNGQGTVTYAINSQKNSSNSTVTYFSLSGTTLTVAANTPVGTYTVVVCATAAGNDNYNSGTKDSTVTVTISTASMTGVSATGYSGTYDATSHNITVTAPNGATVKYRESSSGDYNLTANPTYTDAGTYTVYYQVSKSNYTTVTGSTTVKITKRNVTLTSGSADKTYDKTALTNDTVTVTGDGYASGEGATYNVTGSQTDAGSSANAFTYTLSSGTKADNYNITKSEGTLTVSKKEIGLTWGDTAFTYNGQEQAPTATATGLINGDDCTVTITGGMTNASNSAYTATASSLSNSNYELPSANTTTFTIGKKAVTVTAKDQSVVLNNSIAQGASQAILTGAVNGHTLTDITLTSSSTAAVTTDGTITPSDAVIKNGNTDVTSNYNITYAIGTLTVTKGAPTYTAPEAYDLTYNGDDQELVSSGATSHGTITYSASENGTYTATIPTGKDAGPYDVWWKLTGDEDHADIEPAKITVTINKKAVTVTGIAASDKTYNGNTTAVLTYDNVTFAGKLANDTLTVTATGAFEDANAGTNKTVNISNLTLAGASADNYELAANGHQATATATINPLPVTVTITGNNATAIYDGNAHNISGYVAVADTNLYDESSNFTFSGTAQASQTNAGTAYMGLASDHFTNTNANFNVTFNVTDGYQTVEPAPVTLTANSDTTLIYNESEQTVEGFTCSVDGLTFDGVSASGSGTDVGSYDVTFTGVSLNETRDTTGNYIVTDTVKGTLKISKTDGELTVTPKTLVYNGGEQEFVDPDTSHGTIYYALGDDDVTPPSDDEWSTEIPEGKNHDTYYVWYKLKGDDNHNDTEPACVPVTINKKEIIIKPDDLIKHINKDDPEFTYDVTDVNGGTGLEDGDVLQGLIINKEPGEEPGTYTITVTVDPTLNDNYEINATATATFTITDHIFTSEPTFIWTDDYKDCSAEFTCDYDDGEKEVIQSEIKSREEDGVTYVYAQITVDGVTYTSDEVSIYHDDETQTDDEGNEFNTRIVIKSGFDEIEESLVDIGFDSEEKILEEMLKVVVIREDEAAADENLETVSELYDVELQVSYDGGDKWEPATIDNFPKNGLEVVLPYPDGTDMKTNNFNIYHMFAYDMGGHKAGEVEAPVATKTSNGIKFKVMGLSPIYITWTKAVTGVKLNKESVTLDKENATAKLSGIVEPADAAVKDLIWTSSNEKVAIVDEYGNVTAVGGGSCIITVTSKDGGFTATCNVTVNMPEDEKKEDTVTPTETTPTEVAPAETTPAADKTSAQTQKDNKAPETDDRAPVKEVIMLMISSLLIGVYLTVKRRRSKLS